MSDPRVLEAQVWVNQTYGHVAGFQPCEENSKTGWPIMRSLTMALQHELGISPVVPTFGPTTQAKLQALGPIGFNWTINSRIVRIFQHALFCKGYWGCDAGTEGIYTVKTQSAVLKMYGRMGIPHNDGAILALTAKCILNMDAYVVVAGGTEKIREIQQWLNSRYWNRDAFTIGPCDGIYSRDVQKALMVGLQYELGLSPTGSFGSGTQAGLKNRTLKQGDQGIFVELFSAACVFNEPIGTARSNRTVNYDADLTTFVRTFQRFSQLPETGRGDYTTWAQLLVSMGDPDRPATGCDTRFPITPNIASWLKDNGYKVVGRYLNKVVPGFDKDIKPGELSTIFGAGLRVFPIYQVSGRNVDDFSYTRGFQHGLDANDLAAIHGFPRSTVIYFSVDYDATQAQIDAHIVPYFHGIAASLAYRGKRFLHGVYGSRNVCTNVTNQTFARYSFVSGMSYGFSGNLGFKLPDNWAFNQIKELSKVQVGPGEQFDVDRDVWRDGSDQGTATVNIPSPGAEEFVAFIEDVYNLATDFGSPDRSPSQLTMEFIRNERYGAGAGIDTELSWWALLGGYDKEFVKYVNSSGLRILREFQDPFTGYSVSTEHLMATANGYLVHGMPTNPKSAGTGDIAGWGGDLMTFYADWRTDEEIYASGREYCQAKLGSPTVSSSFAFSDLMEDADGFLIASAVLSGKNIARATTDHYMGTGGLRRFNRFFDDRFINTENCKLAARNALTATGLRLDLAQAFLIGLRGAEMPRTMINLPGGSAKLDSFVQGFVDVLLQRSGMEQKRQSTYRTNHSEFLKEVERST